MPCGTGPGAGAPRCLPSPALSTSEISPQDLANLTAGLLVIDDARLYGLIDGDPGIDRTRCHQVLDGLRARGVLPSEDEACAAAIRLMAQLGAVRP